MQRDFDTFTFDFVCEVSPECDAAGEIKSYMPQDRYTKRDIAPLNAYGAGPFCRFRIPNDLRKEGVYILTVDEMPYYVGECVNLSRRYNMGYGNISPRNCYRGGQATNCRLNNLIYAQVRAGKQVQLWFHETHDRMSVERILIQALGTRELWNRKG